jgi:hypothetical protein
LSGMMFLAQPLAGGRMMPCILCEGRICCRRADREA